MIRKRSLNLVWKEFLRISKCSCSTSSTAHPTNGLKPDTATENIPHISVLTSEVITALKPEPGKVYIDMTFGAGGHSKALLNVCPDIEIIALDRDRSTRQHVRSLQDQYGQDRIQWNHGKFTDLPRILSVDGQERHHFADGVMFDVGASSMQYEDRKRGFSLKYNGALDMRMTKKEDIPTAADILNNLDEKDIARILKRYGEEKKSGQIARRIVDERQTLGPIKTTRDLQDIVREVYEEEEVDLPKDKLRRQRHPATLAFQALRIFVNDELNELYNGLKIAHRALKSKGACAVVTFHSLEHRIVNQVFNNEAMRNKETEVTPDLRESAMLYRWSSDSKVVKPSDTELEYNPRARSAQLRTALKLASFR